MPDPIKSVQKNSGVLPTVTLAMIADKETPFDPRPYMKQGTPEMKIVAGVLSELRSNFLQVGSSRVSIPQAKDQPGKFLIAGADDREGGNTRNMKFFTHLLKHGLKLQATSFSLEDLSK